MEARWEWGDISFENVADCEGGKREGRAREGWVGVGLRVSDGGLEWPAGRVFV